MIEEIEIDGKIIKLKTELEPGETGRVIDEENLEDTIDLSEIVEELNDGKY